MERWVGRARDRLMKGTVVESGKEPEPEAKEAALHGAVEWGSGQLKAR